MHGQSALSQGEGNLMNRMLAALFLTLASALAFGATGQGPSQHNKSEHDAIRSAPVSAGRPTETHMRLSGSSNVDLRNLPRVAPVRHDAVRPADPESAPRELPGAQSAAGADAMPVVRAPAPAPIANFDGLDFATFGTTYPPDANGDVGPVYFIQAINSAVGIFRKSDGARVAAFTLNTFMSQGAFGNLCDTNNRGDAIVLYDSFEDRWVITDIAFTADGSGNVTNPPGAFQCFGVSKTGDPVSGGWNYYSVPIAGGVNDSPKLGIWTDGIYMAANLLNLQAPNAFIAPRVYALNKAQMYAGLPSVQIVSFDAPSADFSLLPSNARLQTGTPPAGTPNYYVSTWQFLNGLTVYKFHVDWDRVMLSSFTGPDVPLAATSWPNASVASAPSLGGNSLDVVQIRAMMQAQYTNLGGAESLWATHTVRRANTTGFAAPRWYQVNVTGGTVAANLPQATTWDPDGANVMHRFIPSLAINRAGDMALGYTTSSSTTKPALKYAGRLAADPINTFSQTEQLLIQGAGTQTGTCAGGTCTRWGEYSSMTLDPDGCTFWMTGEYYAADGLNYQTRIGSFSYPSCTPVGAGGTVSGTVTAAVGGAPLNGATVSLGSRTTMTDAAGAYTFSAIPAGTYPGISASFPGCTTGTASNIVVNDANTTTQNFALAAAAGTACLTDTAQSDFQAGLLSNVDVATSPGDLILAGGPNVDQQNATLGTSGVGITTTTWGGQTFTPSVTGLITRVDVNLFCSGCTGTIPNLTLSIRAASSGLPTGADLAAGTITGFNSGASAYYTATLATPIVLNAGTQYAFVLRPTANPSPGTYALTRSGTSTAGADVYVGGSRVAGATSGTVWSIPLTGGVQTDTGFKVYMDTGFRPSGDLISSVKDANPAPGHAPNWSTLSWNATLPTNTSLRFQVAASNAISGPFNFVGPDGTAGTFYTTSGASLSQFDNNRYLRYRAFLATTDSAVSPTLNDVTVCHTNPCIAPPTPTVTPGGPTTFCAGGSVTLTSSAASGNQWSLNGGPIGGATAQSFIATAAGNYTTTVTNAFMCSSASSAITTVSVTPLPATPTITPGGPTTFYAGGSVTLTSSSASGNQWYLNGNPIGGATSQQYVATASGNYSVVVTSSGCSSTSSSAITVTVVQPPDLAISVTDGVTQVNPGGTTTYTITATNNGPSAAPGSTVADTFPASLTCTWTCTGAGGGSCTASGAGNINDSVNLPVSATVTYTASCTISPSASGMLNNTATVSTPPGATDPAPGNNSATDSDSLITAANLALTLTDNRQFAQLGSTLNYVINVTNAGPSNATVTVTDALPAQLDSGSWTCVGTGGAVCASGSGNALSDVVTLPVGGQAAYLYSATVIAIGANDQIVNTASVAPLVGTDPVPANNSASDTDIVSIFKDSFDGTPLRPNAIGEGSDFVSATLRIDPRLLGTLGIAPAVIASGRAADGSELFTWELARLGSQIALRVSTTDSSGAIQRSAWRPVNLDQRLLSFAWQRAAEGNSAFLTVNGDAAFVLDANAARPLTGLWVTAENEVPWMVLLTH
jgi:uncharacterized repeat protein (TIGR01451 family)